MSDSVTQHLLEKQHSEWLQELARGFPLVTSVPSGAYRLFLDFLRTVDTELQQPFISGLFSKQYLDFSLSEAGGEVNDVILRYTEFRQKAQSYWKYSPTGLQRLMANRVLSPGFDPRSLGLTEKDIETQLADQGLTRTDLSKMRERHAPERKKMVRAVSDVLRRVYPSAAPATSDEAYGEAKIGNALVSTEIYFGSEMPLTFSTFFRVGDKVYPVFPLFEDIINHGQNHWDQIDNGRLADCSRAFELAHSRLFAMALNAGAL
jgi:hypothetical protein